MNAGKVSIIGLGYIGLPTAATIARRGFRVIGVDISEEIVESVNQGKVHIVEPDLDLALQSAVNSGSLTASTTPEPSDVFLIAVPTPFFPGTKKPDLRYVEAAIEAITPYLSKGNLVIIESTCPVGTTEKMVERLKVNRPELSFPDSSTPSPDVHIAYCPERVLPGQVLKELIENDRVVGGVSKKCAALAGEFYGAFVKGQCYSTNAKTAEMVKLVENSFRDVNIAFANEVSIICDQKGINTWELLKYANMHPRVNILNPGVGVGGHCIAVDPWFIVDSAGDHARITKLARHINDEKKIYVYEEISKAAEKFNSPKIACLGISFKQDIDDIRESPAKYIVEELAKNQRNKLLIVEPNLVNLPLSMARENVIKMSPEDAIEEADIIAFLVPHSAFTHIDKKKLLKKVTLDFVGILEK